MKNKKLILYFFIVSGFLILLMPTINFVNFINKNGLSKIKEIKKETLLNIDKFETLVSFTAYKLFDKSIFPHNVVTGKDGFLFLGNSYAEVLNKTNGKFQTTDIEIEQFLKKLLRLQQWYENQGIQFVIAIAPNKHTIYKEELPNWINYDGPTITDKIVEKNKKYGVHLLDLREPLLNAKKDETRFLYQKTDTHWNMLGASVGYEAVIDYMNEQFALNIPKSVYSITYHKEENHVGDLATFLKQDQLLYIQDKNVFSYNFSDNQTMCHGKINNKTGKVHKCKNKSNPIMAINWQPQYIINDRMHSSKKLLFLGDSFATNPSQLYNESFHIIWKFHYAKFTGKRLKFFLKKHKPDVVLFQIVERALYAKVMFTSLNKNLNKKEESRE